MPIVHVTFGTNDLEKGAKFYDAIVKEFGGSRSMETEKAIGWALPDGGPSFGITQPFDGKPANVGNGTMFAIMVGDEDTVQRVHAAAVTNGGSCEGPPGPRPNGFYAAYYRDPDGNKMNTFCMPAQADG